MLAPHHETYFYGNSNLHNNGFVVYNTNDIFNDTLERLPYGYVFLNYSYTIKGTSLITWHRDVTSGQSYLGTNYPTYTAINYLCDGDLLTVCGGSHNTLPFSFCAPQIIKGKSGTTVLFNADLLHAGAPNKIGDGRHAIQYKIAHIDDLKFLNHLQGINVTKSDNTPQKFVALQRWYSWKFAWLSNTFFYTLMQKRHNGILGYIQSLINIDFYNS